MASIIILISMGFIVHLISTSAYAVKSAGATTKKIALAYTLFNLFEIAARTANSIQGPVLAAKVESALIKGPSAAEPLYNLFYILIAFYAISAFLGYLTMPLANYAFIHSVRAYHKNPTLKTLLTCFLNKRFGKNCIKLIAAISLWRYISNSFKKGVSVKLLLLNTLATSLWTIGTLSCLYAGLITPENRLTAISLSAFINGWATVVMFLIVDPYLAIETEKAITRENSLKRLKLCLAQITLSKAIGTLLGIAFLKPCAYLIANTCDLLVRN